MKRLILRRILMLPIMVWLVATAAFFVVHAAPGTYADTIDNPRFTPQARANLRAHYGLDKPLTSQYLSWLGAVLTGDLGNSFVFKEPVSETIRSALTPTVLLTGTALIIDLLIGFSVAVLSVRRPGGWADRLLTGLALGVYGLPSFWLAGLAVAVFSIGLGWFPASHMYSVGAAGWSAPVRLLDLARHLILPASVLGVVGAAATARTLRASIIDIRNAPHILAARARGLSERRVLWNHTVRPALGPMVTIIGLSLPVLVSGSVVVETIFSWPGMGRVMWQAAVARDVALVLGCSLVGAVAVIIGNLVADLLYAVVDPRVRLS